MKISLNFLNRWEYSIFSKYNEDHVPISKSVSTYVFVAAVALILAVFIMQMTNVAEDKTTSAAGIICGVAFLLTAYKIFRAVKFLSTIGSKIGYTAYILALFCVLLGISVYLAMIALVVALICFVLWIAFIAVFGSNSSKGKKKVRAHYNDGTSEDMEEDGRETYYKGKDTGNTYVD